MTRISKLVLWIHHDQKMLKMIFHYNLIHCRVCVCVCMCLCEREREREIRAKKTWIKLFSKYNIFIKYIIYFHVKIVKVYLLIDICWLGVFLAIKLNTVKIIKKNNSKFGLFLKMLFSRYFRRNFYSKSGGRKGVYMSKADLSQ